MITLYRVLCTVLMKPPPVYTKKFGSTYMPADYIYHLGNVSCFLSLSPYHAQNTKRLGRNRQKSTAVSASSCSHHSTISIASCSGDKRPPVYLGLPQPFLRSLPIWAQNPGVAGRDVAILSLRLNFLGDTHFISCGQGWPESSH